MRGCMETGGTGDGVWEDRERVRDRGVPLSLVKFNVTLIWPRILT